MTRAFRDFPEGSGSAYKMEIHDVQKYTRRPQVWFVHCLENFISYRSSAIDRFPPELPHMEAPEGLPYEMRYSMTKLHPFRPLGPEFVLGVKLYAL